MIAVKLVLCDEARRAQIFTEHDHISFSLLVNTAQNLFPSLRGKQNIDFYWNDEDDDTLWDGYGEDAEEDSEQAASELLSSESRA